MANVGYQRRTGHSEMNHESHEKHQRVLAMHHLIGIDSRRTPTGICIHSQGAVPLESFLLGVGALPGTATVNGIVSDSESLVESAQTTRERWEGMTSTV